VTPLRGPRCGEDTGSHASESTSGAGSPYPSGERKGEVEGDEATQKNTREVHPKRIDQAYGFEPYFEGGKGAWLLMQGRKLDSYTRPPSADGAPGSIDDEILPVRSGQYRFCSPLKSLRLTVGTGSTTGTLFRSFVQRSINLSHRRS